jgi:hypothetical protein
MMNGAQMIEDISLVLMQVNCKIILNKSLEFWNLIDTYNPGVIIGKELWLREGIGNVEVFRGEYKTFRGDRTAPGGAVLICVKSHIDCVELLVDEDFEMIAVEVKTKDRR